MAGILAGISTTYQKREGAGENRGANMVTRNQRGYISLHTPASYKCPSSPVHYEGVARGTLDCL